MVKPAAAAAPLSDRGANVPARMTCVSGGAGATPRVGGAGVAGGVPLAAVETAVSVTGALSAGAALTPGKLTGWSSAAERGRNPFQAMNIQLSSAPLAIVSWSLSVVPSTNFTSLPSSSAIQPLGVTAGRSARHAVGTLP